MEWHHQSEMAGEAGYSSEQQAAAAAQQARQGKAGAAAARTSDDERRPGDNKATGQREDRRGRRD